MSWFDAEQEVLRRHDEAWRADRTVDPQLPPRPSLWSRLAELFGRRQQRPDPEHKQRAEPEERLAFPGGHTVRRRRD